MLCSSSPDCSSFQSSQSLAKKDSGFASLRRIFSDFAFARRAFGLGLRLDLMRTSPRYRSATCTRAGISGRCSLTALQSGRFGVVADTEGTRKRLLVSERHYSAPLSRRQVRPPFPHPRRKGATRPLKPRDLSEGTGGREEVNPPPLLSPRDCGGHVPK